MSWRAAFAAQARACAGLGSPFTARLLQGFADHGLPEGAVAKRISAWPGDISGSGASVPLRLAVALHGLVLEGRDPALAAVYPPTEADDLALRRAASAAILAQEEWVLRRLETAPQTNEVGRSCALMPGMLEIARVTGLPLRPREIGSSAGLNQFWDLYSYRLGEHRWNEGTSALTLQCKWSGNPPPLHISPVVASRAGCDINPLDLRQEEVRLRLQAYVWPDQAQRLANLRAAMQIALKNDVRVEKIAASKFAARELASRPAGECIVLYHSIVRQYFPEDEGHAFDHAIAEAGSTATKDRPVAWLRLEQDGPGSTFELRLTLWPTGETRVLAHAHPHGAVVKWLA